MSNWPFHPRKDNANSNDAHTREGECKANFNDEPRETDAADGATDLPQDHVMRLTNLCRLGNVYGIKDFLSRACPQLDAQDSNGATPLCIALSLGHKDIVRLLLESGAAVDAGGNTPLIHAARHGRSAVLKALLDHDASPDAVNAHGGTPVIAATSLGHFGVAQLLLSVGTSDPDFPVSAVFEDVMIVGSLIRVKPTCDSSSLLHRLAACRAAVNSIQDIHLETDQLHRKTLGGYVGSVESRSWRLVLERAEAVMLDVFDRELRDDVQLKDHLASEDVQTEAISVLRYEISLWGEKCSPRLLKLLKFALDRILRLASTEAASLSLWFLSTGEVDFSQLEAEVDGENEASYLCRRKWLSLDVTIFLSEMQRETFMSIVDRWFELSHPSVARLFGASHLCGPRVVVFEDISSSSLREYLRIKENCYLIWQRLYEVALGFRYLHDRGFVLGTLQLDSVRIGADGLAKISAVGAELFPQAVYHANEAVQWKSAEMLRGEAPSPVLDVFSFGICILGVMTEANEPSWRSDLFGEPASPYTSIQASHRPKGFNSHQWKLITAMCSLGAMKRPSILVVIKHLKKFADFIVRGNFSTTNGGDELLFKSLRRYLFPELEGSTIADFMKLLKAKSELSNEF